MNEIFEITRHDMTAFTRSITDHMGDEGRWIHFGITSKKLILTPIGLALMIISLLLLHQLTRFPLFEV